MANPNKAKGTKAERDVVRYLADAGFPHVERRALTGAKDQGDIAGIPGVVISVKDVAANRLAAFLADLDAMTDNVRDAGRTADVAALWWKTPYKGSPGQWHVYVPAPVFFGQTAPRAVVLPETGPIRLSGKGFVEWLKWLGY